MEDRPLHYLSLREVARLLVARKLSPVELTTHMLERIERVDATLKSYATVTADQALAAARVAEREIGSGTYRGPLHGVPVAVKDLCCTTGVRTMGGTPVLRDLVPEIDATVVVRLLEAGAVLLGKLNLTEGAMAGYHPDLDVPLNPWNTGRWPGMSSSGSGVATAAGLCFGAIGTDTGGSIRFPASACGVVGLKPTYGRVSRYGVLSLAESLDHVGPLAREVGDVAVMLDIIAGSDPKDPTCLREPAAHAAASTQMGIEGMRIGIDWDYACAGLDPEQAVALEGVLRMLEVLGAGLVELRLPDLDGAAEAWATLCVYEATLAHAKNYPSRAGEYGPYFREALEAGSRVTPEQLAGARAKRAAFTAEFTAVLESVDALVCPSGGDPAWPVTHELQVGGRQAYHAAWAAAAPRATDFTFPMNLAGTPAICLPCGLSSDGLPYSVQFAGGRLSEAMLCRIAHAYERATPWHDLHPDVGVRLS